MIRTDAGTLLRSIVLLLALAGCLGAMLPGASPAAAAESNLVATGHDTASLVSETDGYTPGHALRLGLRLRLAPGWHSYWSNPGDAGEAPSLTITASGATEGQAGPIEWPAPRRLPDGPLMSYGYTGEVVLPVTWHPGRAAAARATPLHLSATADWLACANVCVPEHGVFQLDLPPVRAGQAEAASPQAPLFAAARARLALPSPFPAVLDADGVLHLSGAGLGARSVRDAWFFPASPGLIDQVAAQKVTVTGGHVAIGLRPLAPLKRLDGLVVLRDPAGGERFLSVGAAPGPIAAAPVPIATAPGPIATAPGPIATAPEAWAALPRLLLFALLGGIVLNLMPCVFPVLAMKALALSRMSGAARSERSRSAAFYTAGVLAAFAALGALTLALRVADATIGWGFQFQSAIFVAASCWLLFAVGLNLAGLFEVGAGAAGLGQGLASRRGHGGDFATGLLAVLVATPCTAPFVGVAVAGAFAVPPVAGMAVFLAMGLGLAAPYILLALMPRLASRLPRPGHWMLVLRQALSFPIFASCAWLAWVTAIEGGDQGVLVLASGLVLLALAGWLLGLSQRLSRNRPGCVAGAVACTLAALALLPGLGGARPAAAGAALAGANTEAFSPDRLAALRAEGRPVFVDMTAAWCVTCLVNERIALSPVAVQAAFASHHVAYLKGDWTGRDSRISDFLHEHGRAGVPFYVYYPSGGEGRVLPQILTAGRMLREIAGPL